ncbi:MAG: DUF11 domain-containing protein [Anaerolineae bacterium]|nr:DUF11 domain-containing protein [Anaerolineae bacterium]
MPSPLAGDGYHPDSDDLVFIHHSCGANWLGNSLHAALLAKEYVDERNDITYGVDLPADAGRPDSLAPVPGETTDMCHWILWFNDYLEGVREHDTEDGFNRIIMFKSCYPMSNVTGDGVEPGDPFDYERTLANYRAVYRHPAGPGNTYTHNGYTYRPLEDILAAHPETLFIPVTAPPRHYAPVDATTDEEAHRARLFNDWLKNDWLDSYNAAHPGLDNVAVFDWFDFLAYADNHPDHPNRLRAEYGGESGNSHPNDYANSQSTLVFASNPDNFIDAAWALYMSSTSYKAASTRSPAPGETLTYTIVVQDLSAPFDAPVDMTDVVPDGLSYIPASLTATVGIVDDGNAPVLYWSGVLTPSPVATITYAVTVDAPPLQVIANSAVIAAPGYHTITRTATVTVTAAAVEPDLSPSSKSAAPRSVQPGQRITYTIAVRDANGPLSPTIYLTDTVPAGLAYVPGSLSASGGIVTDTWAPTLYWSGILSPTPAVTVTYVVTAVAGGFQTITNEARIAVPHYQAVTRSATVWISPHQLFLPAITRDHVPTPPAAIPH